MEIFAKDNKLKAVLEDETVCKKRFGAPMSKKLTARLAVLRAAESLEAFWPPNSGPERCHELKGDSGGHFFNRSKSAIPPAVQTDRRYSGTRSLQRAGTMGFYNRNRSNRD